MLTIKQVKLINKEEFTKPALDENVEVFVVHITFLNLSKKPTIIIYPVKEAQIVLLLIKEVKIPNKYSNFSNVFSEKKALELLEITNLNQYIIKLEEDKQLPYKPI